MGVKADGKYKLTVNLERRIPYFKLLMGFYIFFSQNQKFVEKCGAKYGTAAKYVLSNGPFKMTGWTVRKFASSKYLQYNIAKDKNLANANLRKASSLAINKKELGKKQITISLLGDDTDDAKKVAEFIQSALESTLGIKVEVSNVPFKTRLSRVSSLKFDVVANWLDGRLL